MLSMLNDLNFFKNQYLVTHQAIDNLINWSELILGKFFFYFHPSLRTSFTVNSNSELLIIGDVYNHNFPEKTNKEIAFDLNNNFFDFFDLLKSDYTLSLCGTFLIFYFSTKEDALFVVGDAATQRELYYLKDNEKIIALGATDKVINEFFPLKEKEDLYSKEFYNSNAFKKRKTFVCSSTNYENLYRLKPNFYLNISKCQDIRYFPFEKVKQVSLEEAIQRGAEIIKNYIKAANLRYQILIPVSAGWDSRLLLAASKDIQKEVTYYVLQTSPKGAKHYDIRIPRKLMLSLKLPIEIINYSKKLKQSEIKIAENSISFYRKENLEYIVNYFNKKHPNKITLNGNISEIARMEFDEVFNLNPKKICFLQKYPRLTYAEKQYAEWLNSNKILFEKNGLRVLDMLYWEENCANWAAKSKTEFSTFGTEVLSPFNSRELLLLLNGINKKYRRKQNPVIYKKIIQQLWPEVLCAPVNPGIKKIAMRITQYLGIFSFFRNLKLWWNMINLKER